VETTLNDQVCLIIVTEPKVLFFCIPCVYTHYFTNTCISPSYSGSFTTIIVKGEFLPKFWRFFGILRITTWSSEKVHYSISCWSCSCWTCNTWNGKC